jgi:hypothetical protein
MKKILSLLIALIILVQPVLGAELSQKKADDKPVKKDVELEQKELKESQKEFKKSEFKYGDEKAKSKTDIKLKTEKRQNGLKISAENPGKGSKDKHGILIAVEDIPNFNYKNVRVEHYDDSGTLDARWIQEVNEVDGYVLIPDVEFSSIIVDGFTGTYTKTINNLNLSTVQSISQESGNVTSAYVSIPGADSSGSVFDNLPSGCIYASNFSGNSNDYSGNGNNGVDTNMTYLDGWAIFNGIDAYISVTKPYTNYTAKSVFLKVKMNAHDGSYRAIYDNGYHNSPYGDMIYQRSIVDMIGIIQKNDTGVQASASLIEYAPGEVAIIGYTWEQGEPVYQYFNNELVFTTPNFEGMLPCDVDVWFGRSRSYSYGIYQLDSAFIFNKKLNESERNLLYTEISGTAARTLPNGTWTAVEDGSATLPVDSTVSSIEVVGDGTYDVTTTTTFTEDTTLISESESNGILDISIYKEYVNNATSGYLEYEPVTTNFTYNLSMASSDPNATAITHNQIINVSTGEHSSGDSFYYNFTLSTLESFEYTVNWISKSATKAVVEYNSSNSNVENDFYLEDMSASSTFDLKYSNNTIISNATSDSSGYLQFEDQYLINGTYTVEKQTSAVSFVAVVFTGLSFVGLYFANRFRRR